MKNNTKKNSIISKDGVSYLIPFILITSCFALWGFANDITNPMVKAFSKIFRMSVTDGALVQVAFYGGYFAMAFPAAIFIRRFSYKAGVLLGLGLYAIGAFLFYPAMLTGNYYPFLIAYFILTCGLSFLETSCNPYILSMGDEATSTRRLNLAQSFNPMGSLLGMYVAMNFIQNRLNPMDTMERSQLSDTEFAAVRDSDLMVLIAPYLIIGLVILAMLIVIRMVKMPKNGDQSHNINFLPTLKRIFGIHHYSTVETLRTYIHDIRDVLEPLADGDLTVSSDINYKGDFVTIGSSLNTISSAPVRGVLPGPRRRPLRI